MKEETKSEVTRRKFLVKIGLGLGGLAAALVAIPVVGALLAPLLQKNRQTWRTVGLANDFANGTTTLVKFENADPTSYAGITAKSAAWLRRDGEQQFTAFSVNCSHLGCPVRWEAGSALFMCPCHGGIYYKDGTVAAGPPPKELTRYQVRISSGKVQILTAPLPLTTINA